MLNDTGIHVMEGVLAASVPVTMWYAAHVLGIWRDLREWRQR